jgi:elongation factor 3
MTDEDIAKLDLNITVTVNDEKVKRTIDKLTFGRRTIKKEREYEVTLVGQSHDNNVWLSERDLIKRGFQKMLKVIDSKQDAAEGTFRVALTQENVEEHLQQVGMTKENASHVKIGQLSNGDKVKVVIGAALWSKPHILILDEPTNNIDRDGLSALCVAINEFKGGVIIITHDEQFCHSICKEIWVIENGILNIKGDPDWMSNALIETTQQEEMVDALGNVVKVKQEQRQLTRKEKLKRKKRRESKIAAGEPVSSDEDSE